MSKQLDYSKSHARRTMQRGMKDSAGDSEARALIRRVVRDREGTQVSESRKALARDVVFNYEGADDYIIGLQKAHGDDADWMPSPWVTRAVLSTVGADAHRWCGCK